MVTKKRTTGPAAHRKANTVTVAEQRIRCYELRMAGHTITEIARMTGLSRTTVHTRITEEVTERVEPWAVLHRQMQLDRIESYLSTLDTQIAAGAPGIPRHIEVAIKAMERQAKLLGLDAPAQVEATLHRVDEAQAELTAMLREAAAKVAAQEATMNAPDGT